MSLSKAVDVMQETPLFARVDPKRLRLLAFMSESLTYRAGELLFEQGAEGDSAFVVLAGEVSVLLDLPAGRLEVAALGPKQIFGEMSVLCDIPRTASIAAKSDVEVLRIPRDVVLKLLREFPDMALEVMRVLALRLDATNHELSRVKGELDRLKGGAG